MQKALVQITLIFGVHHRHVCEHVFQRVNSVISKSVQNRFERHFEDAVKICEGAQIAQYMRDLLATAGKACDYTSLYNFFFFVPACQKEDNSFHKSSAGSCNAVNTVLDALGIHTGTFGPSFHPLEDVLIL